MIRNGESLSLILYLSTSSRHTERHFSFYQQHRYQHRVRSLDTKRAHLFVSTRSQCLLSELFLDEIIIIFDLKLVQQIQVAQVLTDHQTLSLLVVESVIVHENIVNQ